MVLEVVTTSSSSSSSPSATDGAATIKKSASTLQSSLPSAPSTPAVAVNTHGVVVEEEEEEESPSVVSTLSSDTTNEKNKAIKTSNSNTSSSTMQNEEAFIGDVVVKDESREEEQEQDREGEEEQHNQQHEQEQEEQQQQQQQQEQHVSFSSSLPLPPLPSSTTHQSSEHHQIHQQPNMVASSSSSSKAIIVSSSKSLTSKAQQPKSIMKKKTHYTSSAASSSSSSSTKKNTKKEMNNMTGEEILESIIKEHSNDELQFLVELVGATNLSLVESIVDDYDDLASNWNNDEIKPYCVVRLGEDGKVIHRTKKAGFLDEKENGGSNPVWTVDTKSLFLLKSTPIELLQNKLTIQLYTKRQNELVVVESINKVTKSISNTVTATSSNDENNSSKDIFLGQVQLNLKQILTNCNDDEGRMEYELCDELNEYITVKEHDGFNNDHKAGKLALRFRIATQSDIDFIHTWSGEGKAQDDSSNNKQRGRGGQLVTSPKKADTCGLLPFFGGSGSSNITAASSAAAPTAAKTTLSTQMLKEKSKRHLLLEELHQEEEDDDDEEEEEANDDDDDDDDDNENSEYRKQLLRANSCFHQQLNGKSNKQTNKIHTKLGKLITEEDETEVAGNYFTETLKSVMTRSSYIDKQTGLKKIKIKPYPDPTRPKETTYLTKHEIKLETRKPSQYFVDCGSGNLGKLYVEVLSCSDLPNVDLDIGEITGNVTDPFVALVYEDVLVQTTSIDDELNPHFMPWTQRAFCFNMIHPASTLYLGVFDYDLGPLQDHDPIGRVAINMNMFRTNTVYTLKYHLYPSSNRKVREADGAITIRLRLDIPDEKAALIKAIKSPRPKFHVNVTKEKSFKVLRYVCFGEDGFGGEEEKFSIDVLRSYINEIFEYKSNISYAIKDGLTSLLLWRGQVQINFGIFGISTLLPIHSLLFFMASTTIIEKPYLLPPFTLLFISWILLILSRTRIQHPSPWYRCPSFWYYLSTLKDGGSGGANRNSSSGVDSSGNHLNSSSNSNSTAKMKKKAVATGTAVATTTNNNNRFGPPRHINAYEGYEESVKYDKKRQDRLDKDLEINTKKAELQQKLNEIGDDKIRTHVQNNSNTLIPLDLLCRMGRYQTIIGNICRKFRMVRVVVTWEESILSFWIAFIFLSAGLIALFLPWAFILTWTSRIVVWGFFGPHMKIVDWALKARAAKGEKNEIHSEKLMDAFDKHKQIARERREDAVKLKAIKSLRFGKYITLVPSFNLARHYDRPLPESTARPYRDRRGSLTCNISSGNSTALVVMNAANNTTPSSTSTTTETKYWIPGQQLYGHMIPRPEKGAMRNHELSIKVRRQYDTLVERLSALHSSESSLLSNNKNGNDSGSSVLIRLLNEHRHDLNQLRMRNNLRQRHADDQEETGGYELVPYFDDHTTENEEDETRSDWIPTDEDMARANDTILSNMMNKSRVGRLVCTSLKTYERMNLRLASLVSYRDDDDGDNDDLISKDDKEQGEGMSKNKSRWCNMVAVLHDHQISNGHNNSNNKHKKRPRVNFYDAGKKIDAADEVEPVIPTTKDEGNTDKQLNSINFHPTEMEEEEEHEHVEEQEQEEEKEEEGKEEIEDDTHIKTIPQEIQYETDVILDGHCTKQDDEGVEIVAVFNLENVGYGPSSLPLLPNSNSCGTADVIEMPTETQIIDDDKKYEMSALFRATDKCFVAFYRT